MENQVEVWKDVVGYDGIYKVSDFGNIYNIIKNKKVNFYDRGGYCRCALWKNGIKTMLSVHRVVLISHLDNPQNKPQVNHINAIKTDNRLINLEWCTGLENIKHARKNNLYPKNIQSTEHKLKLLELNRIKVIDTNTGIIYNSITEVAEIFGYKKSTLIHYLLGYRKNKTSFKYYKPINLLFPK